MRVRHKTERREVEYEVIDEGVYYYTGTVSSPSGAVALSKRDYEPSEDWEDVTEACRVLPDGRLFHQYSNLQRNVLMVGLLPGYRFRAEIVKGCTRLIVERHRC